MQDYKCHKLFAQRSQGQRPQSHANSLESLSKCKSDFAKLTVDYTLRIKEVRGWFEIVLSAINNALGKSIGVIHNKGTKTTS